MRGGGGGGGAARRPSPARAYPCEASRLGPPRGSVDSWSPSLVAGRRPPCRPPGPGEQCPTHVHVPQRKAATRPTAAARRRRAGRADRRHGPRGERGHVPALADRPGVISVQPRCPLGATSVPPRCHLGATSVCLLRGLSHAPSRPPEAHRSSRAGGPPSQRAVAPFTSTGGGRAPPPAAPPAAPPSGPAGDPSGPAGGRGGCAGADDRDGVRGRRGCAAERLGASPAPRG